MSLFGEPVEQEIKEEDFKEKSSKITPFDFLNSINYNKENLMLDEKDESQYKPFIVNRGLSFGKDTVLFANAMNQFHFLDNKVQYNFLRHGIRKAKRFNKWIKNEYENIEVVKDYYGYSSQRAKDALKVLSQEDIDTMKVWLDRSKGGSL